MARKTSCIAGAWPRISGVSPFSGGTSTCRRLSSIARRTRSTAWSTSKGFGRYSNAPPWNAATALSRSEYAVMMITGRGRQALLQPLHQLQPREAGHADVAHDHLRHLVVEAVERFLGDGEGAVRDALARERLLEHPADRAVVVDDPDGCEHGVGCVHRNSASAASRGRTGSRRVKRVRPGTLSNSIIPWWRPDEALRERQAQAGAALAAAHHRIEDQLGQLRGHARAVVLDGHGDGMAVAAPRDRHLARDARDQADLAAPAGRLRGVARDVEDRLDQALLVAHQLGQARVVVARDLEALGELGEQQHAHALDHLVDVDRLDARQPVGREQAVHERLQAIGFLHDHLRELAQLRVGELPLEQLRRAADAAQRVLDLVGEVAHQLAVGLLLLEDARLARDLELLLELAELQQQLPLAALRRG